MTALRWLAAHLWRLQPTPRVVRIAAWAALALCAAAIAKYWEASATLALGLGWVAWTTCAVLLVAIWATAVANWRLLVRAIAGAGLGWSAAARQLGLLLCGKYLPGGVWGFVARHVDASASNRPAGVAVAGVAEQLLNLASVTLVGALFFFAARADSIVALAALPAIAAVAVVPFVLVRRMGTLLSRLAPAGSAVANVLAGRAFPIDWRLLLGASALSTVQQATCVVLVAVLVFAGYALDATAAMGVGGAYALAIGVGMLALFAPGGIAVREMSFVVLADPWLDTPEAVALSAVLRIAFSVLDIAAGTVAAVSAASDRGS